MNLVKSSGEMSSLSLSSNNGFPNGIKTDVELREISTPSKKRPSIDPKLLEQAFANNPFETVPRIKIQDAAGFNGQFAQDVPKYKRSFMESNFPLLFDIGLQAEGLTIEGMTAFERDTLIEEISKGKDVSYQAFLKDQIIAASNMVKVFELVGRIASKHRLEEKHLTALHCICTAFGKIDMLKRKKFSDPLGVLCEYNYDRYIFELPHVLHKDELPSILLAYPVWYNPTVSSRESGYTFTSFLKSHVFHLTNVNYQWFFQIFNHRERDLEFYPTIDPIPHDYLEVQKNLTPFFASQAIVTPYLNRVAGEWADPSWFVNTDPLGLCFYPNDIPFFVVIKRWSGNGLFPQVADLIADTVAWLKKNAELLKIKGNGINTSTLEWYGVKDRNFLISKNETFIHLYEFAQQFIKAFEQNRAIPFLRGEK